MLYHLTYQFSGQGHGFNVFRYITYRTAFAALTALLISFILGPWLIEQMKMIMNEYRLNLGQPEAQEFLLKQMEEYFFGKGSELPPEFKPESH